MVRVRILVCVLLVWMSHARADQAPRSELRVGDQAPPFTLTGSDGRTYQLSDYRGKQVVILAWFAKAFTSG